MEIPSKGFMQFIPENRESLENLILPRSGFWYYMEFNLLISGSETRYLSAVLIIGRFYLEEWLHA